MRFNAYLPFVFSKDEPELNHGEVDEYLLCAIDARSIDRLKSQYCYPITLKFRDTNIEQIVSTDNYRRIRVWSQVVGPDDKVKLHLFLTNYTRGTDYMKCSNCTRAKNRKRSKYFNPKNIYATHLYLFFFI